MIITKMALPRIEFNYTIDCEQRTYTLSADATAPLTDGGEPMPMAYTLWSSVPNDQLIDGNEEQTIITVAPQTATDYILFADYRTTPFCPATSHISLTPIKVPEAEIKVNPQSLSYENLEFSAFDISINKEPVRAWYVDWVLQEETGPSFYGHALGDADSVTIAMQTYNGQCYDTASVVLPIRRVALFAPNAFTPQEETNNRFVILGTGIIGGELYVYNRDGLLIHYASDYTQGWDGRKDSDGAMCPQGNYVWKLIYRAIDRPSANRTEVGMVLLIK